MANHFFQLVNARYEKGSMILTSNRGFAEWGDVFGDPVVATALLDRLLHHAVVIQIEGSSYRLRQHADLVPEHLRCQRADHTTTRAGATPPRSTTENRSLDRTRRLITDTLPTRDFSSGSSRENSIGVDSHPPQTLGKRFHGVIRRRDRPTRRRR